MAVVQSSHSLPTSLVAGIIVAVAVVTVYVTPWHTVVEVAVGPPGVGVGVEVRVVVGGTGVLVATGVKVGKPAHGLTLNR
jgi:hypothetical protein